MHNQPLADRLPILTTSDILMAISQKEPLMAVQTLPRPFDAGHGGAVYVPVAIPEDIDPAEVSSLVEAIQKAMGAKAMSRPERTASPNSPPGCLSRARSCWRTGFTGCKPCTRCSPQATG